jgi:hypothetical protein
MEHPESVVLNKLVLPKRVTEVQLTKLWPCADGLWLVFEDADKQEVDRLDERDVRSIHRDAA